MVEEKTRRAIIMPKEEKMPGIRFYLTELELMENILTDEEFVDVVMALKEYVRGYEVQCLSEKENACYLFMRERVEADMRSYRETCERNRINAQKRWEKEKKQEG